MPISEHIAASRAEQDQEGINRMPVTDAGMREADPQQEPLNDTSAPPEPESGPRGQDNDGGDDTGGSRGRPKPLYMSPSDEARLNIAKRFKRDDDGKVPFNGDPNDPEMLYGKHGRQDEPEPPETDQEPAPAAAPQSQQQEPLHTIKVRGKEIKLTTAELLERASKVEAADSYLDEGRALLEAAREANRNNRERAPADPHRPEDRNNTQDDGAAIDAPGDPQHPGDELEGAIDEVRYGTDSKEAAGKLRKVIVKEADKAADQRQLQRLIGQDNTRSSKAMKAFIEANADLANDEIASAVMEQQLYKIQREELIAAGIDETKLPKDSATLAQWHQFQRIHGAPVSNQEQMLTKAKQHLDSWRGGPSRQQPEQRKPSVAPRVEVNVDRNARRAALPNQPTRTMAPPQQRPQNDPAQRADRSSVIANMRKARGQIVA